MAPFYSGLAYSFGALMGRYMGQAMGFFEALGRLRARRLVLCTGLPWFLIKGAELWTQGVSHLPLFRTALGIQVFLGALVVGSTFVTFVFAVTIALIGPRFALTRFFIKGPASESR